MPGNGQSSPWRPLVKGAAAIALTAAFAVPLLRKKRRIPPSVTTAALAAGPPALAVLRPRTRLRDAGMYALQMWMFTLAHELPYDDPEALRRRVNVRLSDPGRSRAGRRGAAERQAAEGACGPG